MKTVRAIELIVVVSLLSTLGMQSECKAERPFQMHKTYTEEMLDSYFVYLAQVKKICGRYPLSLAAIREPTLAPKKDLNCPQIEMSELQRERHQFSGRLGAEDGWIQAFSYSSDGNTYLLRASHGYFLTDRSPANSKGKHFENPNPPPDDPPPFPVNSKARY
jgi:hypothetical protein